MALGHGGHEARIRGLGVWPRGIDLSHLRHFFEFFDAYKGKHVLREIMKDGLGAAEMRVTQILLGANL